jgi:hypothetical protein
LAGYSQNFTSNFSFVLYVRSGLQEEGIFRKAGSAARIKTFRSKCDECKGDVNFEALAASPHDVAALLKQLLRFVAFWAAERSYLGL